MSNLFGDTITHFREQNANIHQKTLKSSSLTHLITISLHLKRMWRIILNIPHLLILSRTYIHFLKVETSFAGEISKKKRSTHPNSQVFLSSRDVNERLFFELSLKLSFDAIRRLQSTSGKERKKSWSTELTKKKHKIRCARGDRKKELIVGS